MDTPVSHASTKEGPPLVPKEGLDNDDRKTKTATNGEVSKKDLNLRTSEEERKKDIFSGTNISAGFNEVFSKTTFLVLLLFVVVYYIAYVMIHRMKLDGEAGGEGGMPNTQNAISRTVDFVVVAIVLLLCVYYFANIKSAVSSNNDVVRAVLVWTRDFFENPANLVSLPLSIVVFYSIVYLCQIPMADGKKPYTIAFLENKFWILLGLLVVFLVFKYGLGFSVNAYIMNHLIYWWDHARKGDLFDKDKDKDTDKAKEKDKAKDKDTTKAKDTKEVFNVSKNVYTYDEGRSVCQALGARLATYDEVESSHKDGGEWCNYGWSEGQMILFPTQKATWERLQKVDGHHNDCGRPGINGGYIENPNARFGVNCFGKKPAATADDLSRLKAVSADAEFESLTRDPIEDAKIKYWKDHSDTFLQVNSFNRSKWSEGTDTNKK